MPDQLGGRDDDDVHVTQKADDSCFAQECRLQERLCKLKVCKDDLKNQWGEIDYSVTFHMFGQNIESSLTVG